MLAGTKLTADIFADWEAFAPTLTGVTVGNGVLTARRKRIGKTVHYRIIFVFGSTSAFTGSVILDFADIPSHNGITGSALYTDVSAPRSYVGTFNGSCYHSESGNAGIVNATNPFTWAVNDVLTLSGTYEAD